MQSSVWAVLLRHIPADQHDNLMLVTSGGTEIALQCVLRVEQEFMAVKGRLAGSQDAGRVFFIPFNRIDYLGFQKALKEADFHEMFKGLDIPAAPAAVPPPPPEPAPPPAAQAPQAAAPPAANGSLTGSGERRAIKSAVLERFRSRSLSNPGGVVLPPPDA